MEESLTRGMSHHPAAAPDENREIHWPRIFALIRRRKGLIFIGPLAVVLSTWLFGANLPKVYRGTSTIILTPNSAWNSSSIPISNEKYIIQSIMISLLDPKTVGDTLQKFKLNKSPFNLSPQVFIDRNIKIKNEPRGSHIIILTVELTDPRLALETAYAIAQEGAKSNLAQMKKYLRNYTKSLEKSFGRKNTQFRKATEALDAFRRNSRKSNIRRRLFSLQVQLDELNKLAIQVDSELSRKRAESLVLEKTANRTPPPENLPEQLMQSRLEYASLKANKDTIEENKRKIRPLLSFLTRKLTALENEEQRLINNQEFLRKNFRDSKNLLYQNQEFLNISPFYFSIIRGAIPSEPVRPRVLIWTILSGVVTLPLFICLAFLMEEGARRPVQSLPPKDTESRMEQ